MKNISKLTVNELKIKLKHHGASTRGRKIDLIERLEAYDSNKDFGQETLLLPPVSMPDWPEEGYRQLSMYHSRRDIAPPIHKKHIESYFIHRQVVDQLPAGKRKSCKQHFAAQNNCTSSIVQNKTHKGSPVKAEALKGPSINWLASLIQCIVRRCLALCYTMDTADIQAVARDHDYLRQLFTEYWIYEANAPSVNMANTQRAPKQWCLTKTETVNSFENWRQNLIYTLSLDTNFTQFFTTDANWGKKCASEPNKGFTDDDVIASGGRTALQQVYMLELMLGQVANYCPVISRNTIVKNSTSLSCIWQTIRLHYGFQSTGAHFLDFADIQLQADEDLYQRLVAFVEDNMLQRGSVILHHGDAINVNEEMTPSLENMVVLTWLRLINVALPNLVKQRYGTELRARTLASIKPDIS
ncbi:hypothetical protein LSAT2_030081 [Lamellibrachia satsuma]|nr:hypothetical protein LSAT2_030081 [Lamellibrachia satsuma]